MDRLLNILAITGLVTLIIIPVLFYSDLPNVIPTHYGFSGKPDGFGSKSSLWILVGIGLLLFIGLKALLLNIHRFNYAKKLTEEQSKHFYQYNKRILQTSAAFVTWLFSYINFATIQNALGNMVGLGKLFMPVVIIFSIFIIIYQVTNAKRLNKM